MSLLGGLVRAPLQTPAAQEPANAAWQPLFDGKTLTNWKPTKFMGEGAVKVENGQIILETGSDLTGITWTGPELPKTNYEIALQAMRVEGRDFFAGVTFPVDDSFCSLILGGWGGTRGRAVQHQRHGRLGEQHLAIDRVRDGALVQRPHPRDAREDRGLAR